MLLKNSVVLAHVRVQTVRVTSYFLTAELQHPEISELFVATLTGTRDPEQACRAAQCSAAFVGDFMGFLHNNRLLYEFDPAAPYVDARYAAEVLNRDLDYWSDTLYCDAFWDAMQASDHTSSNTIYAWAVENYHHTHAVLRHLGAVLAYVSERPIIDKCLRHMSEEWDHPYLFRLCATRFRQAHARPPLAGTLVPLGSTEAVCHVLRLAARHSLFAYKTCVAVLEKTARRVQDTRDFFRAVAQQQAFDFAVVAPLVTHAETDEGFDHLNSLTEFAALCRPVPIHVVRDAVRLAYTFAEALQLWQYHMLDWYLQQAPGAGHRSRIT